MGVVQVVEGVVASLRGLGKQDCAGCHRRRTGTARLPGASKGALDPKKHPVCHLAQVVYSVMVDRFANGDITNDLYNIPHYQKQDGESEKASPS